MGIGEGQITHKSGGDTVESVNRVEKIAPELVRKKLDELIEQNKNSNDEVTRQTLTRERYGEEFLEIISLGLAELAETFRQSSPELQELIITKPSIVLSFSGMLPECNYFLEPYEFEDPEKARSLFVELAELTSESNSRCVFVNDTPRLFNEKSLNRLSEIYPEYVNFPGKLDEESITDYIVRNPSEYLLFTLASKKSPEENFDLEVRNGLISGFELESCRVFAAKTIYDSFTNDPYMSEFARKFFKFMSMSFLLKNPPEVEALLERSKSIFKVSYAEDASVCASLIGMNFAKYNKESEMYIHDWNAVVGFFRSSMHEELFDEESV